MCMHLQNMLADVKVLGMRRVISKLESTVDFCYLEQATTNFLRNWRESGVTVSVRSNTSHSALCMLQSGVLRNNLVFTCLIQRATRQRQRFQAVCLSEVLYPKTTATFAELPSPGLAHQLGFDSRCGVTSRIP